ncbi:3-hydroxyacyl-CoA dehydrogenase/enoyl-CoA hydratase family protein [Caenispirillum bisanense]|uniref:3-hydroxyacyl-CoA dehydrogenase n=1 Tax=Caenispirillum bisanense TaxID=414052 RepID=A0A286GLB3_9PROT|nr:3-hydroxyacyl-CoA dehydrogenase/enoyl-CoA hydratase family protein [Caenispirillum bisanense]SOD96292.1 3-hydroxyacyl-CoA dehydrogenase [Caenispirillum bisanense]
MTRTVRKAAVLGAGSMGGGIAAQFANAGVPVVLLDVTAEQARAGLARQIKAGAFMHDSAVALVETGGIDADLGRLADADWIVEAVVENLDVKRALFARVEAVRRDGAAVSSNTSTIPLARLTEGLPERFARDFVITHFFNPVRHMRLLEVVAGPRTDPATAALVREAADRLLGKTVIDCRDTPAFIANRIGCYWMTVALMEAFAHGLTVEEADAVAGRPFGIPPTGIFGLFDLVGIDLVPHVWGSLFDALPADDAHRAHDILGQPRLRAMIEAGQVGRKAGGGFYRMVKDAAGRKTREVMDLDTGAYRPEQPAPAVAPDLATLMARDDALGRYAWAVLSQTVSYAAAVAPVIADDPAAVDAAMELGYNWSRGPFALADAVGCRTIADRLAAEGRDVPPLLAEAAAAGGFHRPPLRAPGVLRLDDAAVMEDTPAACLRDLGDGIACLSFRTKMNVVSEDLLAAVERVTARRDLAGLVLANDHPRAFSAGADLAHFVALLDDPAGLDAYILRGQQAFRALRAAPFPVVGAPQGVAVGGGCEILLHCDAVQAWAEAGLGLVERLVGIIPGWGGTTRLLLRMAARADLPKGPLPAPAAAFETIAGARISRSALEARAMGFLGEGDGITMNRDRLLADAKARCLALAPGYAPSAEQAVALPGPSGRVSLMNGVHAARAAGRLSPHDVVVLEELAAIVTGGDTQPAALVAEDALYALEREAVRRLAATAATRDRLRAMLETGKPLAN